MAKVSSEQIEQTAQRIHLWTWAGAHSWSGKGTNRAYYRRLAKSVLGIPTAPTQPQSNGE